MIGYADTTPTAAIERDRFEFRMHTGDTFGGSTTWLGSPQLDRGLQVKSVVNLHAFTAKGGDANPGNHAWRPPDW